ncbi:MAG: tetratricopeptide repeat protein [Planctomycetota bacterium]
MPDDVDPLLDQTLTPAPGQPDSSGNSASILQRLGQVIGARPSVALRGGSEHEQAGRASGKYVIADELGHGGVGTVFRGRDTDLGREVAMKFLHERYRDDPAILHRFVEEAQIGGQLQHPGVVPVYDLGMDQGQPFFAMKLVKGDTLARLLADRAGPDAELPRFLDIFESICQTMAYAHARGVVHRDLKPANVMIGRFGEVQVVDWGMGKVMQHGDAEVEPRPASQSHQSIVSTVRSGDESTRSMVGSVMGTPAYMPPEQARGDVAAMDERSDVFALGAMLCEILTGAPPYTGSGADTLTMAAMASLDDAYARLDACGADPELITLARRCLIPAPAARPRNAEVVAKVVHEHLVSVQTRAAQARVEAAEAEVRAEGLRRAQRLGIALTTAIAAGLVASLWLWRQADEAAVGEALARADAVAAAETARENESIARQQTVIAKQQTTIAERELQRAMEIKTLLTDILASVQPETARDRDTRLLIELLDKAEARIADGAIEDPLVEAELRHVIGGVYLSLAQYDRADRNLTAAYAARAAVLGPTAEATLNVRADQIVLLKDRGRINDAEALTRETLAAATTALGKKHPLSLNLRGNLALFVKVQGRLLEAEVAFKELMELQREALGHDHQNTFATACNYANLLFESEKFTEAEQLMLELREAMRRTLGADSPSLAVASGDLALLYSRTNRFEQAKAIFEEALDIQRRMLREHHPDTIRTMANMGGMLIQRGNYESADAPLREVLAAFTTELGPEHRDTNGARITLAGNSINRGRIDEGVSLLEEAIEIAARTQGDDAPTTLMAKTNLAKAHLRARRGREAEALMSDVVDSCRRLKGDTAAQTCTAILDLANARVAAGKIRPAMQLLREALAAQKQALGQHDRSTVLTSLELARLLIAQQKLAEGEALLREVLQACEDQPDADPLLHARTLAQIAHACMQGQRLDEAERLYLDAGQRLQQLLGDDHPDTARVLAETGTLRLSQGRFAEAAGLLEPAVARLRKQLGDRSQETLQHATNLASAYLAQGQIDRAEPLLLEQVANYAESHGTDSPVYGAMVTNLGQAYLRSGRYADAAAQFEISVPIKRQTIGLTHIWTQNAINGLSDAYAQLDRRDEALALQRELLEATSKAAKHAAAPTMLKNQVAQTLVTHRFEELQDPALALELATAACARAEKRRESSLWACLDTLALAQHRTGDDAAAAATMQRALELAPADADASEKERMQRQLSEFKAAAAAK